MNRLKEWFKVVGIRTLKTMGETAASLLTVGSVISDIDWRFVISSTVVAGIYTILVNIGQLPTKVLDEE